jgi:hypothetical protein
MAIGVLLIWRSSQVRELILGLGDSRVRQKADPVVAGISGIFSRSHNNGG